MKRFLPIAAAAAALIWVVRADVTPPNSTGVEPIYAYKGGLNESINLYNGNLNIVVPILSLKGRAGLDLGISFSYDSRQMRFSSDPENGDFATWNYTGAMTGRWVANFTHYVREYSDYNGSGYRWYADITTEQGTQHHFDTGTFNPPPNKGVGKSTNSTDMQYDFDARILRLKNGVWYNFADAAEFKKGDANGNYITYIRDGSGRTTRITDTLGRNVDIFYENGADTKAVTRIRALNNAGAPQDYLLTYEFVTVDPSTYPAVGGVCYGTDVVVASYSFLKTITLPDGKAWTFTYYHSPGASYCPAPGGSKTSALLLSRVDYPMGGYSRYNYTAGNGQMDAKLAAKIVNSYADQTIPLTPPGSPSNLLATASGAGSVGLAWSAAGGDVDHYEIERSGLLNNYVWIGNAVGTTSWTDTTAGGATAYLYRVKAVAPSGAASGYSNADLATTAIFSDDPLVAQTTETRVVHLIEMRSAVNAVRACAGQGAAAWTDPTLTAEVTEVRAVHLQELRDNLNTARSTLGLATLTYTDPTLTPGQTEVKAVHYGEVRQGVK